MSDPYLLLWLEGPLQSWGYDSKFGRRETLGFPTQSGVLGIVLCAMGAGGAQQALLAELSAGDLQVIAYGKTDKTHDDKFEAPTQQRLLRDFHMVGSGYNEKDPWQCLLIPKTQDGKKAVGGGTKLTYRYYLQDHTFAVILQVPEALAEAVASALQTPVWDVYLGRKCCVPTDVIFRGCMQTPQQAIDAANDIGAKKSMNEVFRVLKGEHLGQVMTLNDVPVRFGHHKIYRDRRVTLIEMQHNQGAP